MKDIELNLTDEFKLYWDEQTKDEHGKSLPYEMVFDYIKYISMQPWYREQKKTRKRMYFCIPKQFRKEWIDTVDVEKELEIINNLLG